MRFPLLLVGALLNVPVLAQAQPQEPSGYDLLVQAGGKISLGPDGDAYITDPTISPEENLRRERLAVARNAPALTLVRLALQKPVEIPARRVPRVETAFVDALDDVQFNARARELARQFSQESDVRFADGDYVGAMNSKLDTMELGAVVGHGELISMINGTALEAIGAIRVGEAASHLDAAQCRAAAARLGEIEARRASLAQVLRAEQKFSLQLGLNSIEPKELAKVEPAEDGTYPTAEDIRQLKALTPARLAENNDRVFDAAVRFAPLPYPKAIVAPIPDGRDPLSKMSAHLLQGARYRYGYDRTFAQMRLLRAALELRAQKLESGAYPETFVAPTDPFSPDGKPLVYKKTDRGYLLYSFGPDGKDNGGAEIQTVETNEETGVKTVTKRLRPESTGDIVQDPI